MLSPHGTHWIGGFWYPQGQCGHEGITFTLFMVYLLVLVVANIIINDTMSNSKLYMICTSYLSTILEGMWKDTKKHRKIGLWNEI
jgi:hypothetical protein